MSGDDREFATLPADVQRKIEIDCTDRNGGPPLDFKDARLSSLPLLGIRPTCQPYAEVSLFGWTAGHQGQLPPGQFLTVAQSLEGFESMLFEVARCSSWPGRRL